MTPRMPGLPSSRKADTPSPSRRAGIVLHVSQLTFNAVFEDAGDGWVYVHVPELPEVHTQGKDLDEAREMVRDAIALVLEDRKERGEPIPDRGWALVEQVEVAA
jgi:predicted RNase H-like HicB family nuclease